MTDARSIASDSAADPSSNGVEPVVLTRLPVGAEARLHTTLLEREDFELLEALGLTTACRLRICQAGDPWIVQVRATRIGIADSLAPSIFVIPDRPLPE